MTIHRHKIYQFKIHEHKIYQFKIHQHKIYQFKIHRHKIYLVEKTTKWKKVTYLLIYEIHRDL